MEDVREYEVVIRRTETKWTKNEEKRNEKVVC